MSDPKKTAELAFALRAAGLTEKADAMLSSAVREEIGLPASGAVEALSDRFNSLREEVGLPPRRTPIKRRKRAGVGRARRRVAAMLAELGFHVEPGSIMCSVGWTRSVHKMRDDTTLTWECWADHERDFTYDGKTTRLKERIHLFSWERL